MFIKINTTALGILIILAEIYLLPDTYSNNTIVLIAWIVISVLIHRGDVLGKMAICGFGLAILQLLFGDSIHAAKIGIWILLLLISSTVYNLRNKNH